MTILFCQKVVVILLNTNQCEELLAVRRPKTLFKVSSLLLLLRKLSMKTSFPYFLSECLFL